MTRSDQLIFAYAATRIGWDGTRDSEVPRLASAGRGWRVAPGEGRPLIRPSGTFSPQRRGEGSQLGQEAAAIFARNVRSFDRLVVGITFEMFDLEMASAAIDRHPRRRITRRIVSNCHVAKMDGFHSGR